jgi:hypothetical protein
VSLGERGLGRGLGERGLGGSAAAASPLSSTKNAYLGGGRPASTATARASTSPGERRDLASGDVG